jgi:CheY-like chemotaxis protein
MSNRVLIVEDEPAQRRILEEMIKRFGFETLSADSGQKALELVSGSTGSSINLIVLDLVMPGMDGYQAARWIRDRDRHGRMRLIALTGVESPDVLERAARAGFDEFLKKPVSGRTLLGALGKAFLSKDADAG